MFVFLGGLLEEWDRKTLDWGGKVGKGGGNEGVQKNYFGTTPYFLVIANDQEG